MNIIFFGSLLILFYIYLGYPFLLLLISLFKKNKSNIAGEFFPSVSIIIAAYNEEKVIEEKIKNTIELLYPKEKFEMIVFSDSSTDHTDEIVKSYEKSGVKLLRIEGRRGKAYCQNRAVEEAKGEIIVFSDANSIYQKDAIKKLVRNFTDERVGCVSGELEYVSGNALKGNRSEGLYWKYEKMIKRLESRVSSLIGANGAIYAVREKLYIPLENYAISDFAEPLMIYLKGFRTVYESEAIALEENPESFRDSYHRRVRIMTRTISNLIRDKKLFGTLNPFYCGMFSLQFFSHKILRWFTGLFLLALFFSNLLLCRQGIFYQWIWWGQIIFYMIALYGFLAELTPGICHSKISRVIFYFCLSSWAMLVGIKNALFNKAIITWETNR